MCCVHIQEGIDNDEQIDLHPFFPSIFRNFQGINLHMETGIKTNFLFYSPISVSQVEFTYLYSSYFCQKVYLKLSIMDKISRASQVLCIQGLALNCAQ